MKKKIIGTIIIILIILGFVLYKNIGLSNKNTHDDSIFVEENATTSQEVSKSTNIKVYVNGEVKCPGVYTLSAGSRVEEAVLKAGGLTELADRFSVNMAKKLKDEDYVIIENKNIKAKPLTAGTQATGSISSGSDKIDINSATKEQLKTVPGIGEITATKIIEYREKNGAFKSIEDLKKVGRIGDKTIEKFKEKIEVR